MKNWHPKKVRLFVVLSGIFVCNALIAEFIGVKIFSLEGTLGFESLNMHLFGIDNLSFNLTCGVLIWPVVFILTDLINEYYGIKGVKLLSFLAVLLITYAFIVVTIAIGVEPADFWRMLTNNNGQEVDMQLAYSSIFGQGLWIIVGSLVAFLVGQFIDVFIFKFIKRKTGEKYIWLRATGSTFVSQLIDSYIVLYIAFVLGPQQWSISLFLAVGTVNYFYKFIAAFALTPVIYLGHNWIEKYLGDELAKEMKNEALIQ